MQFIYIEPQHDAETIGTQQDMKNELEPILEKYGFKLKAIMDFKALRLFMNGISKIMTAE